MEMKRSIYALAFLTNKNDSSMVIFPFYLTKSLHVYIYSPASSSSPAVSHLPSFLLQQPMKLASADHLKILCCQVS